MNKVEFCQKNVFFLVSPGTYWSTCFIYLFLYNVSFFFKERSEIYLYIYWIFFFFFLLERRARDLISTFMTLTYCSVTQAAVEMVAYLCSSACLSVKGDECASPHLMRPCASPVGDVYPWLVWVLARLLRISTPPLEVMRQITHTHMTSTNYLSTRDVLSHSDLTLTHPQAFSQYINILNLQYPGCTHRV